MCIKWSMWYTHNAGGNCEVQQASKENVSGEWKPHTIFKLLLERIFQNAKHWWAGEPAQNSCACQNPWYSHYNLSLFFSACFSLLFSAFSYINICGKKSQNLSPHLHWGNCSISKTINTSARELSTKGISRNACREPAVHNLTPAWETIPSVWEQSRSYGHRCPAWENSWVKERTDCFIISLS